jgi:hypothetical protein
MDASSHGEKVNILTALSEIVYFCDSENPETSDVPNWIFRDTGTEL